VKAWFSSNWTAPTSSVAEAVVAPEINAAQVAAAAKYFMISSQKFGGDANAAQYTHYGLSLKPNATTVY
jgi:hypothetical protein